MHANDLLDICSFAVKKKYNLKSYDASNTGGQSQCDSMKNKFKVSVLNNSRIYRVVEVVKQSII